MESDFKVDWCLSSSSSFKLPDKNGGVQKLSSEKSAEIKSDRVHQDRYKQGDYTVFVKIEEFSHAQDVKSDRINKEKVVVKKDGLVIIKVN